MRALLLLLAACSSPSDRTPAIARVVPDYGPLVGGTRIVIEGSGFTDGDAGATRVFVAGREAPLAHAVDDATLEVVIPPGDAPGPTELIVLNGNGNAIAVDRFRYSTQPAIADVSPREVIANEPTTVVVTGSGFADEEAGTPTVLVDGTAVTEFEVVSDGELRFVAPADRALGRPRIEIANVRGLATRDRAFRYRPTANGGLLLFPRFGSQFAIFYDPIAKMRVDVPRTGGQMLMSTIVVDTHGEYWATEGNRLGRVELGAQRMEGATPIQFRFPAMTRVGDVFYAIDRWTLRLSRVALDGTMTPVGVAQLPCCGSYGLAYDGEQMYMTYRAGSNRMIATVDPATGTLGTPVTIAGAPSLHVEELRAFRGTLYAASRDGTLVSIDPQSGAVTIVTTLPRANAMEVFD